jgi:ATP-dependent RNA helicase DHX29
MLVKKIVSSDSEEKLLAKLAVTYGVLRRLGFSETHVEECLKGATSIDLEDAYEWVCLVVPFLLSGYTN